MSEVAKVYKQYGEMAGKQYLILFYSSLTATSYFVKSGDEKRLTAYKAKLGEYIKKEYGTGFYSSYCSFEKEAESNQKLINELSKQRETFIDKRIIDLAKDAPEPPEKEESWKAAARRIDVVGQQTPSENGSRHGSVNIRGTKADIDYSKPDEALPVVKQATFLQPHDADNWVILGDLYAKKKDWASALSCYEKALLKNPKSLKAAYGKERAQKQLGSSSVTSPGASQAHAVKEQPAAEDAIYYFENTQEFILYVKLNKDKTKGNIVWGKGAQYLDECKRGYRFIDQKQYVQAIDAYKNALKYNPVGVTARFEICTAYSQMHDTKAAREMLKEVEPYVYSDKLVAKYYRCLGFILVEEKDYKVAANVYQYSLYFDSEQPTVKQELLYIVNQAGFEILDGISDRNKVERILVNAGIPLLKPVLDLSELDQESKTTEKPAGERKDEFGWIIDKDNADFVRCPKCNNRVTADFMKLRSACINCGYEHKK